jgi:hypothetical protein
MSGGLLGAIGAAVWVMVLIAQLRRRRTAGGERTAAVRRARARDHRG